MQLGHIDSANANALAYHDDLRLLAIFFHMYPICAAAIMISLYGAKIVDHD